MRFTWSVILLLVCSIAVSADDYPSQPLTMVVGFGVGGSADRMARAIAPVLSEEIGQPIQVINLPGAGTMLAANSVLVRPADGYTLFASTFSPYLLNTILDGNAKYGISDFAYLNFQWFDEDLIAISKASKFQNLGELLEEIRTRPKTVRASVVKGSAGHLMVKLLLETAGIPQDHLNLVAYNSGGQARAAVAGGVVDFIVISAEGTESIREYLRPVAIIAEETNQQWNVPTLNQVLAPMGLQAPILPGSIRGIATSSAFRTAYPERFQKVVEALQRTLARDDLREQLKRSDIGYRWIGVEKSNQLLKDNFEAFDKYSYLLNGYK